MYDELLKQWANEQGFQTWSQDHAAVLRNLTSWLNQHAAQHSVQRMVATLRLKMSYSDNFMVLRSATTANAIR